MAGTGEGETPRELAPEVSEVLCDPSILREYFRCGILYMMHYNVSQ
jgi:hypothetical protein